MPGEYIIGDSAYPSTPTCIPLYKGALAEIPDNRDFNHVAAHLRIVSEHTIGAWKNRFSSCKELRRQIRTAEDVTYICRWMTACVVLHNMMMDFDDPWVEEDQGEESDNDDDNDILFGTDEVVVDNMCTETGQTLREAVKEKVIEAQVAPNSFL